MSKGINAYLIDAETRHQIFIQRFAGGVYKKIDPVISQLKRELLARLAVEGSEIAIIRARVLLSDISDIFTLKSNVFGKTLESQLEKLAEYEINFQARLLGSAVTVETARPTIEQVLSSITSKKMTLLSGKQSKRLSIPDLVDAFFKTKSQEFQNIISSAIVAGTSTPKIVGNITSGIEGVLTKKIRREAESLVRTATNHAATTARSETMRANEDILEGERFIATLDNRTTITCAGFDGKVFPLDDGPVPPLHYNCRSTRIPIIKESLRVPGFEGARPEKGDDGPGVTSAQTTYNSFLERQSPEFQDEVLGKERARLFRSGLHVDKFTDVSGRVYTLDELKAMDERFSL